MTCFPKNFSMTSARFAVSARPLLALVFVLMLPGCFLLPYDDNQEKTVKLNISIQAAADLNPDEKSRPSPLLVRVYELRSETAFIGADFFSLQDNDKATLTEELLTKDEFIIHPGDRRIKIRRKARPQIRAIGIFAAYRNLPHSTWRAIFRLPPPPENTWYRRISPSETIDLKVLLESNAVKIFEE